MAWVCAEPSRFRTSDKPDERFHVQQDARHVRTSHRTCRTCTGKSAWHSSNENENPARRAGPMLSTTPAITVLMRESACPPRTPGRTRPKAVSRSMVRETAAFGSSSACRVARKRPFIGPSLFSNDRGAEADRSNRRKSSACYAASAAVCFPTRFRNDVRICRDKRGLAVATARESTSPPTITAKVAIPSTR
jgi:hypothetical protein